MFGRGDITVNILNNIYIYTQPDLTTKGECVFGRGKVCLEGGHNSKYIRYFI